MIKADLHLHTRYSDGSNTVDEIVQKAVTAGLSHIAITDHDNLKGYDEKYKKATDAGLIITKSVELSAKDYESGRVVHVLGYNIKVDEPILKVADPIILARNDKAYKQVKILQSKGYDIDFDKLYAFANGYIFKQHIFEMLYNSGQVESIFPSMNETMFRKGGDLYFGVNYMDVIDAVKAIKEAGGYAVIAHPNQQNNITTIQQVAKYGLDGVELNHEANGEEYRKLIQEYAKKYDLLLTGGSDYHGAYARRTNGVGSYLSEESGLQVFE